MEEKFIEIAMKALICLQHGLLSHTLLRNSGLRIRFGLNAYSLYLSVHRYYRPLEEARRGLREQNESGGDEQVRTAEARGLGMQYFVIPGRTQHEPGI